MAEPFIEHMMLCTATGVTDDHFILEPHVGLKFTVARLKDDEGRPMDATPEMGSVVTVIIRPGDLLNARSPGIKHLEIHTCGRCGERAEYKGEDGSYSCGPSHNNLNVRYCLFGR